MELVEVNTIASYNSDEIVCCICLDNNNHPMYKMICCKQIIHQKCLLNWILNERSKSLCPTCRQIVNLKEYIILEELLHKINNNTLEMTNIDTQYINEMLRKDFHYQETITLPIRHYSLRKSVLYCINCVFYCICMLLIILIVVYARVITQLDVTIH